MVAKAMLCRVLTVWASLAGEVMGARSVGRRGGMSDREDPGQRLTICGDVH